ncbi:MAG: Lrp/AsnC family transcriptional regulator [Microvirga sp.]|nr:Lrp/AsnC family transcriptional regulator [Microvirga sp.]
MDAIDQRIISILRTDGRITNADLAEKVGLSPSACLRRVRLLEESGTIRGYSALINDRAAASETVVIVQITLERQTDEYLRRFEKAACQCPDIYERIHTDVLSCLPGVARIQSSFAIRAVIKPPDL